MKICQKCLDDINKVTCAIYDEKTKSFFDTEGFCSNGDIVSDSECQFWAHEAYNRVRSILKAGIEDMGKEMPT